MKVDEYTKEEIEFLIENYSKYGSRYCADKLGRATKKISQKAFHLGLKVSKMALRNNIMKNMYGKRFGKLIVLDDPPFKKNNSNGLYWKCKCDCGNLTEVQGSNLLRGQKSCGCSKGNHKHGLGRYGKLANNYKMWRSAKIRANKSNMSFTITPDDIIIPERCPLLNIPIFPSKNTPTENSPTLDRIDNSKGYSPENIWVISYKANRTKSNLNLYELKMMIENLEQKLVEQKIHETRKS